MNETRASTASSTEYFAARRDTVRRTAYLLCGDWHWADDLAQEAFVRLASRGTGCASPRRWTRYVRTCLVRVYLSESRRLWRRRERIARCRPSSGTTITPSGWPCARAFVAALRTLPPRQRATLVLPLLPGPGRRADRRSAGLLDRHRQDAIPRADSPRCAAPSAASSTQP